LLFDWSFTLWSVFPPHRACFGWRGRQPGGSRSTGNDWFEDSANVTAVVAIDTAFDVFFPDLFTSLPQRTMRSIANVYAFYGGGLPAIHSFSIITSYY